MLTKTYSAALTGIEALPLEVEVNASGRGEQDFVSIVGLPDAAVRESRERIRSALYSCGYNHPSGATLVNLAPADIKKEGAGFDLPIALGLIAATGQLEPAALGDAMVLGELALDGMVRPVRGVLSAALMAREFKRVAKLIVPAQNVSEAVFQIESISGRFSAGGCRRSERRGASSGCLRDGTAFCRAGLGQYPGFFRCQRADRRKACAGDCRGGRASCPVRRASRKRQVDACEASAGDSSADDRE